jgi:hypothetical protein
MRKLLKKLMIVSVLALVLVFPLSIAQSQVPDSEKFAEFIPIGDKYIADGFNQPESVQSWKDGLKRDFNLDLQKLDVKNTFLGAEDADTYVALYYQTDITTYCINQDNNHVRAMISLLIVIGISKETKQVLGGQVLQATGIKILEGWDGKDI